MTITYYRAPVTIALGAWLSIERKEFVVDLFVLTIRAEW